MFPSDDILLARGKYATLSKERRALLRRIQSSCSLLMDQLNQIMRDAEKEQPDNGLHLSAAANLLEQAGNARAELIQICKQRVNLREKAWGHKEPEEEVAS